MKLLVVIPAFNEENTISRVVKSIPKKLPGISLIQILVVDDASTDNTNKIISKIKNVVALKHLVNRGLGGALQTGLAYAKLNRFDILVTLDADGQHDPSEISKLILPIIKRKADAVIGSRLKWDRRRAMPLDRVVINLIGNLVTFLIFLIWTSDSQSGFRVLGKKAISNVNLRSQKMEVSSEFFKEFKRNNLKVVEIPIKPIYTSYSRLKGQNNLNSVQILTKLLLNLAR